MTTSDNTEGKRMATCVGRRATLLACGIALMIGGLTGCGKNTGTEMPKNVSAPPTDKPESKTVMETNAEPGK